MKILALDQSSVKTGVAIFNQESLISYNIIDLVKEKDLVQRSWLMYKAIYNLIEKEKPEHIVFEDISLQTNVATLVVLARLQGVIILSAILHNIPYTIYKPTSWRKLLGFQQGRGVARKELKIQSLKFVKEKYNLEVKEDIAEAICIGSAFLINDKNE